MNTEELKFVILDMLLAMLAIFVGGITIIVNYSKYKSTSTALAKIRGAKVLPILCSRSYDEDSVVIFRGQVALKSAISCSGREWLTRECTPVLSGSGAKGVLLRETKICIHQKKQKSRISTLKGAPFVIVPSGMYGESSLLDYVNVKMEESSHPLPLTTVYCQSSPTTYNISDDKHPARLVVEQKILPLGKEITAIGKVCIMRDGTPQIKACIELPYFLSDMTKAQILEHLGLKMNIIFRTVFAFESLSMVIFGYAMVALWQHSRAFDQFDLWKCTNIILLPCVFLLLYFMYFVTVWRCLERIKTELRFKNEAVIQFQGDEGDNGDLPDVRLCVICFVESRAFVFVPCGHLVCCDSCAQSVQRAIVPNCPVCRQTISSSVRIYL